MDCEADLSACSLAQLRKRLFKRGLSTIGKKADLIARLKGSKKDEETDVASKPRSLAAVAPQSSALRVTTCTDLITPSGKPESILPQNEPPSQHSPKKSGLDSFTIPKLKSPDDPEVGSKKSGRIRTKRGNRSEPYATNIKEDRLSEWVQDRKRLEPEGQHMSKTTDSKTTLKCDSKMSHKVTDSSHYQPPVGKSSHSPRVRQSLTRDGQIKDPEQLRSCSSRRQKSEEPEAAMETSDLVSAVPESVESSTTPEKPTDSLFSGFGTIGDLQKMAERLQTPSLFQDLPNQIPVSVVMETSLQSEGDLNKEDLVFLETPHSAEVDLRDKDPVAKLETSTKIKEDPVAKETSLKIKEDPVSKETSPKIKEVPVAKETSPKIKEVPVAKETSPKIKEDPVAKETSPKIKADMRNDNVVAMKTSLLPMGHLKNEESVHNSEELEYGDASPDNTVVDGALLPNMAGLRRFQKDLKFFLYKYYNGIDVAKLWRNFYARNKYRFPYQDFKLTGLNELLHHMRHFVIIYSRERIGLKPLIKLKERFRHEQPPLSMTLKLVAKGNEKGSELTRIKKNVIKLMTKNPNGILKTVFWDTYEKFFRQLPVLSLCGFKLSELFINFKDIVDYQEEGAHKRLVLKSDAKLSVSPGQTKHHRPRHSARTDRDLDHAVSSKDKVKQRPVCHFFLHDKCKRTKCNFLHPGVTDQGMGCSLRYQTDDVSEESDTYSEISSEGLEDIDLPDEDENGDAYSEISSNCLEDMDLNVKDTYSEISSEGLGDDNWVEEVSSDSEVTEAEEAVKMTIPISDSAIAASPGMSVVDSVLLPNVAGLKRFEHDLRNLLLPMDSGMRNAKLWLQFSYKFPLKDFKVASMDDLLVHMDHMLLTTGSLVELNDEARHEHPTLSKSLKIIAEHNEKASSLCAVKKNITKLLQKYPEGIITMDFWDKYRNLFGELPIPSLCGFKLADFYKEFEDTLTFQGSGFQQRVVLKLDQQKDATLAPPSVSKSKNVLTGKTTDKSAGGDTILAKSSAAASAIGGVRIKELVTNSKPGAVEVKINIAALKINKCLPESIAKTTTDCVESEKRTVILSSAGCKKGDTSSAVTATAVESDKRTVTVILSTATATEVKGASERQTTAQKSAVMLDSGNERKSHAEKDKKITNKKGSEKIECKDLHEDDKETIPIEKYSGALGKTESKYNERKDSTTRADTREMEDRKSETLSLGGATGTDRCVVNGEVLPNVAGLDKFEHDLHHILRHYNKDGIDVAKMWIAFENKFQYSFPYADFKLTSLDSVLVHLGHFMMTRQGALGNALVKLNELYKNKRPPLSMSLKAIAQQNEIASERCHVRKNVIDLMQQYPEGVLTMDFWDQYDSAFNEIPLPSLCNYDIRSIFSSILNYEGEGRKQRAVLKTLQKQQCETVSTSSSTDANSAKMLHLHSDSLSDGDNYESEKYSSDIIALNLVDRVDSNSKGNSSSRRSHSHKQAATHSEYQLSMTGNDRLEDRSPPHEMPEQHRSLPYRRRSRSPLYDRAPSSLQPTSRGAQKSSGRVDDRVPSSLQPTSREARNSSGSVDDRGAHKSSGRVDLVVPSSLQPSSRGAQTFSGRVDDRAAQQSSGRMDDRVPSSLHPTSREAQKSSGRMDDQVPSSLQHSSRGAKKSSGRVDDRGAQQSSGRMDDRVPSSLQHTSRGAQQSSGRMDDRGAQQSSGRMDERGAQKSSGRVDDRGAQQSSGRMDDRVPSSLHPTSRETQKSSGRMDDRVPSSVQPNNRGAQQSSGRMDSELGRRYSPKRPPSRARSDSPTSLEAMTEHEVRASLLGHIKKNVIKLMCKYPDGVLVLDFWDKYEDLFREIPKPSLCGFKLSELFDKFEDIVTYVGEGLQQRAVSKRAQNMPTHTTASDSMTSFHPAHTTDSYTSKESGTQHNFASKRSHSRSPSGGKRKRFTSPNYEQSPVWSQSSAPQSESPHNLPHTRSRSKSPHTKHIYVYDSMPMSHKVNTSYPRSPDVQRSETSHQLHSSSTLGSRSPIPDYTSMRNAVLYDILDSRETLSKPVEPCRDVRLSENINTSVRNQPLHSQSVSHPTSSRFAQAAPYTIREDKVSSKKDYSMDVDLRMELHDTDVFRELPRVGMESEASTSYTQHNYVQPCAPREQKVVHDYHHVGSQRQSSIHQGNAKIYEYPPHKNVESTSTFQHSEFIRERDTTGDVTQRVHSVGYNSSGGGLGGRQGAPGTWEQRAAGAGTYTSTYPSGSDRVASSGPGEETEEMLQLRMAQLQQQLQQVRQNKIRHQNQQY